MSTACFNGATLRHLSWPAAGGRQARAIGRCATSGPSRRSSRRLPGQRTTSLHRPRFGTSRFIIRRLRRRSTRPQASRPSARRPPNSSPSSGGLTAEAAVRCSRILIRLTTPAVEMGSSAKATLRWRSAGVSTKDGRVPTRTTSSTCATFRDVWSVRRQTDDVSALILVAGHDRAHDRHFPSRARRNSVFHGRPRLSTRWTAIERGRRKTLEVCPHCG